MTDELFFEESARFFERLERELSLGRRDWAVRMPVHLAGDSLHCAFALPRGAAAAKGFTAAGRADLSEFPGDTPRLREVVWSSLFPEEASWSRRRDFVERNPPAQENIQRGDGSTCLTR